MKRKFGERTTQLLYILEHVERKQCPVCKLKVPKLSVTCPNCGFNPPVFGGFLNADDVREIFEDMSE